MANTELINPINRFTVTLRAGANPANVAAELGCTMIRNSHQNSDVIFGCGSENVHISNAQQLHAHPNILSSTQQIAHKNFPSGNYYFLSDKYYEQDEKLGGKATNCAQYI